MSARGKGAVAAGHPLTAKVGADVLCAGGNAVDAAIAAAFASFVTESPLTGPGGGGFLLVHDQGREELIDFFVTVPGLGATGRPRPQPQILEILFGGTTPVSYFIGGPAVAVPGMLAGLGTAHARHGSMPWAELLRPAISLARQGVEVTTAQAYIQRVVEPILRATDFGRRIYGQERLIDAGETLKMAALANTLEIIAADGVDSFYRGDIAREMVSYLEEQEGLITLQDLHSYEAVIREPIRTHYRGYEFVTNPPPSSGGLLVAHTLSLLDRVGLGDSANALKTLAEALRASSAKRDGDFYSRLYDDSLLELLDPVRLDEEGRELAQALAGQDTRSVTELPSSPSTTHLSVIDSTGQAASLTASTGAASGMFVPRLGLSLNNMLGEADLLPYALDETDPAGSSLSAGTRLTSMMSPSLLKQAGEVKLVLGSAGAARLRSAIVQVAVNVIDRGLPLQVALERPRLHLEGETLHLESGFALADVAALERAGYQLHLWPGLDFYFGGAAAVAVGKDGFEAAGDSRRGGAGLVV